MTDKSVSQSAQPTYYNPLGLISGAIYPLRALWLLLRTPRLQGYILMPILLNIVLGVTLYAGLLVGGMQAIDTFIARLPVWTAELSQEVSEIATKLPDPTVSIPPLHLPELQGNAPSWLPSVPDLPFHRAVQLPQWQIPSWLTNWQIRIPNWVNYVPNWGLAVLVWLLRLVLILILLLVTGFIFLQFGVLLGAPWYGKLSEEIERIQTGELFLIELNPVQDIGRAILYELKKLPLTIGLGLPLLLLNFFPGIGTLLGATGGIMLGSTIACMDFLDAAVERRRPTFRQKLGIVFRSLPASGSFGFVCLGLASIPFVNLIAIPICVTAGTLFFCDRVLPWFAVQSKAE